MSRDFIDLEKRSSYGHDLWYVRSSHAEAVFTLTGRKTVTPKDVAALESLGFEFFCTECTQPLTANRGKEINHLIRESAQLGN